VLKIWREGRITVKKADSKEGFRVMLQRNPDTCFGAIEDGELCGVILGGFDGRRGSRRCSEKREWKRSIFGWRSPMLRLLISTKKSAIIYEMIL